MRLLLVTGLLLFHFFAASGSEAAPSARSSISPQKGEARFYATLRGAILAGWTTHPAQGIKTPNLLRQPVPAGNLPGEDASLRPGFAPALATPLLNQETHCIPIALQLLFPGHYFW